MDPPRDLNRWPPAKEKTLAKQTAQCASQDLLGVCLNGHLADSTIGKDLARLMAASAESGSGRATGAGLRARLDRWTASGRGPR